MQNNIGIASYSATFWVRSIHDSELELVLEQADDRNGNPRGVTQVTPPTHTDKLLDMLNQEFVRDDVYTSLVGEYGNLHIDVVADTIENLQSALVRCDAVVGKWINKYRINHMKLK